MKLFKFNLSARFVCRCLCIVVVHLTFLTVCYVILVYMYVGTMRSDQFFIFKNRWESVKY